MIQEPPTTPFPTSTITQLRLLDSDANGYGALGGLCDNQVVVIPNVVLDSVHQLCTRDNVKDHVRTHNVQLTVRQLFADAATGTLSERDKLLLQRVVLRSIFQ